VCSNAELPFAAARGRYAPRRAASSLMEVKGPTGRAGNHQSSIANPTIFTQGLGRTQARTKGLRDCHRGHRARQREKCLFALLCALCVLCGLLLRTGIKTETGCLGLRPSKRAGKPEATGAMAAKRSLDSNASK
jgi:hypothetical protein